MKKLFFILIISAILASSAQASEIIGNISTNPHNPAGGQANPPVNEPPPAPPEAPPAGSSSTPIAALTAPAPGGAPIWLLPSAPLAGPVQPDKQTGKTPAEESRLAGVFGIKIYAEGSLLRGDDNKIYLVQGLWKKHIASLRELGKYPGKDIIKATAEELSAYQTRSHMIGELIRQISDDKVYQIIKGGKHHVLNLAELRARYFGLEIFNISPEEMALY